MTGTGVLCRCAALLSAFAVGAGVKVPSNTAPLAWLARKPGCTPNIALNWSTSLTASGASSARAAGTAASSIRQRLNPVPKRVCNRIIRLHIHNGWTRYIRNIYASLDESCARGEV